MGQESVKWKLCFDDRKTQLSWLVAITDLVADSSVKEYNAKVLAAEKGAWEHGGFHRLYEEGDVKLFNIVRDALMASGAGNENGLSMNNHERAKSNDDTPIEQEGSLFEAIAKLPEPNQVSSNHKFSGNSLSVEKLYQALAGINLSILYLTVTQESTSFLVISWWQVLILVNAFMAYIFFSSSDEKAGTQKPGNLIEKKKVVSFSESPKSFGSEKSTGSPTSSMVGAQLLKTENVPLSDMPSMRDVSAVVPKKEPHRSEPLSESEMEAHLHERWAQSAPDTDLSGSWTLIADDTFKKEYDTYLTDLGFNRITRGVACSLISRTTEITKQSDNGRDLYLKGINPKGAWERTLTSSGYPDFETKADQTDYAHMKTSIKTAESEEVAAEAWWECRGTKHRSWLRGGKKGDYESLRYVEDCGNVLVCESIFHPKDKAKKKANVKWRFQRDA